MAACVGKYFNVSDATIAHAISSYLPENNRSQLVTTAKNKLIVDAYNANPTSMEISILNFNNIKSENKLLILGDMFELGECSGAEHLKILELIQYKEFKEVYLVGSNFSSLKDKFSGYNYFENSDALVRYLNDNEISGKSILLKASRGIQLEKVIPYL